MRTIIIGVLFIALGSSALANAAKPAGTGGGGPKGGPGTAPPTPNIVYMSSGSHAPNTPAIRGVALTITNGTVSSTDTQLAKALAGRDRGSIAWSPDGTRYAWIEGTNIETRKIMWTQPGKAATVLYQPNGASDPYIGFSSDGLAWGDGCDGDGSVVVFPRWPKWDPELGAYTERPAIMAIHIESGDPPIPSSPYPILDGTSPNGFAFSPEGQYLAFDAGYGKSEIVSIVPMCTLSPTPDPLLTWDDFGAAEYRYACDDSNPACPCGDDSTTICVDYPSSAVQSIDWSADGKRLALSVIVGPDPDYPWRDLSVAYLGYRFTEGKETVTKSKVEPVILDSFFGAASSEHSPQWGSSETDNHCQRLAFSQSAGASDGSTMNGRRLFLLDLESDSTACLSKPLEIPARDPRAIDWK